MRDKVISVLLAKRLILQARKAAVMETATIISTLDDTVKKLYANFRNTNIPTLSQSLHDVPRMLFMLRRGPLLGPILQHSDDIDYCRCLFLQAALPVCLRLMDPPFYQIENGDASVIPLEDLALQSNRVLLLDHHTEIFIWEGLNVERREQLLAMANQLAVDRANNRFPRPYIMQFRERSSMARWLLCRLIPSHKDSKENQLQSFPELGQLTEAQYQALLRKFHNTDDFSFVQYCSLVQRS